MTELKSAINVVDGVTSSIIESANDPSVVFDMGTGMIGDQLLLRGIRTAVEKSVTTRLARSAATKMSKTAIRGLVKRTAEVAAERTVVKSLVKSATKMQVKAAMGPIGWALLAFDVISLGLDMWDPMNLNALLYKKDLRTLQYDTISQLRSNAETMLIEDPTDPTKNVLGRWLPVSKGGPFTFPMEQLVTYPESAPNLPEFADPKLNQKLFQYYLEYMKDNNLDVSTESDAATVTNSGVSVLPWLVISLVLTAVIIGASVDMI